MKTIRLPLFATATILLLLLHISGCTQESVDLNTTYACTVSENGLRLELAINTTSIHPGDRVCITVDETNILTTTNTVMADDDWPLEGLTDNPCDTLNRPFWITIYKGYYDATNVTSATPVPLHDPGFISMCPELVGGIHSYEFQPESNNATIYQRSGSDPDSVSRVGTGALRIDITSDTALWSAGTKDFTPGVYTVAAGDEWGTITVLHFTVV